MNAMIYIRGNPADYDDWASLGNEGWGFRDVLPYFKKSERQERGASEYHGASGPLNVADLRCVNPLTRSFLSAAKELGIPANSDFNGATQDGAGLYQVTQKNGQRHSSADAYLKPALARENLTVLAHAHATRIVLENHRAVGIEYIRGDASRNGARRARSGSRRRLGQLAPIAFALWNRARRRDPSCRNPRMSTMFPAWARICRTIRWCR